MNTEESDIFTAAGLEKYERETMPKFLQWMAEHPDWREREAEQRGRRQRQINQREDPWV